MISANILQNITYFYLFTQGEKIQFSELSRQTQIP